MNRSGPLSAVVSSSTTTATYAGRGISSRGIFFDTPNGSLAGTPRPLESQSADPEYAEFVEHTRWMYGGVAFEPNVTPGWMWW